MFHLNGNLSLSRDVASWGHLCGSHSLSQALPAMRLSVSSLLPPNLESFRVMLAFLSQSQTYGLNAYYFSKLFNLYAEFSSVQFSSITQSCPTLCDPMNRSTPGIPVHHQLPEFTQTHIHRVSDAIQPSHPLLSPFPPDPDPSQHQSLFQWVNSSHEVAKVLEFQPQHQSLQWTPRTGLL